MDRETQQGYNRVETFVNFAPGATPAWPAVPAQIAVVPRWA
eukprot:COSAG03_NODE_25856_length_263_cov_0.609756_1_plen_40_part_10